MKTHLRDSRSFCVLHKLGPQTTFLDKQANRQKAKKCLKGFFKVLGLRAVLRLILILRSTNQVTIITLMLQTGTRNIESTCKKTYPIVQDTQKKRQFSVTYERLQKAFGSLIMVFQGFRFCHRLAVCCTQNSSLSCLVHKT